MAKRCYRLPDDPITRRAIWRTALGAVKKARREVAIEKIELDQENLNMDIEMAAGKNLRSEKSSLKKLIFQNRMKELCLIDQTNKLEEAIGGGASPGLPT